MKGKPIPSLTGLRAVAILLVLWMHSCMSGYVHSPGWVPSGRIGVSLFFVLSGYLITTLLLRETDLWRFWARRALRIFPPFYVYLFCVAPFTATRDLLAAGLYVMNFFPQLRSHDIAHTWSLSFEEQYYLLWPFLLKLLGVRGLGVLALAGSLGWPLLRLAKQGSLTAVDSGLLVDSTSFDTLLFGSGLALLGARYPTLGKRWWNRGLAVLLPTLATMEMLAHHKNIPRSLVFLIPTIRDFYFCWIVWWSVHSADHPLGRFLNSRPMVYLGTISYSVYLWQQPFLGVPSSRPAAMVFLEIFLCANASYWLIERPLQGWRARWRPAEDPPGAATNNDETLRSEPLAEP